MKLCTSLLVIAFTSLYVSLPTVNSQTFVAHESSLRTDVLASYEYKIRPEDRVTCSVRLSLFSINVLDVPGQSLSVSGWLTVEWNDTRLVWTPASYGNIDNFYDTELVLWRPELIVDNSISNVGVIESDKLLIRVTSDGEMTWETPEIFVTHCEVDVTFYPFDTQTCEIEVTSWSYTHDQVDLEARDSDVYLEDFRESGEWEILSSWSDRRLLEDNNNYHSQIDFIIKLRRLPSYYVMTILIPVIVTSVLGVLVFLVPVDSGEKVGYTLTIMLTYVVMLTLVAGYMPPTSKTTSVLSIYLTIVLFAGVIATLVTVLVLYFHHHTDVRPVPPKLHSFFLKFIVPLTRWKREVSPDEDDPEDKKPHITKLFVNSPNKPENGANSNRVSPEPEKRKMSTDEAVDSNGEMILSWQELALILDAVAFRFMGMAIGLLTLIVLLTLLIGGYSA